MAEGIERFEVAGAPDNGKPEMVRSPNPLGGGWVRHSDHQAALTQAVREEREQVKAALLGDEALIAAAKRTHPLLARLLKPHEIAMIFEFERADIEAALATLDSPEPPTDRVERLEAELVDAQAAVERKRQEDGP